MIDAFASLDHLYDHAAAVWRALPDDERGTFYVASRALAARARADGIEARRDLPREPGPPLLVANYLDLTESHSSRAIVYLQHGAGQTYTGVERNESYAGGRWRHRVVLFLEPHERTAELERAVYPQAQVAVVGSPYLDELTCAAAHEPPGEATKPTVALAWHWNLALVPETRWAWDHFRHAVRALAEQGDYELLGHGHPRALPSLTAYYRQFGIEVVPELAEVCRRADLLVLDNTSAGPLFAAATGRPLCWLDAPWYRRDVEHGGRFWQWPHGQASCAEPEQLAATIVEALADPPAVRAARAAMVDGIYAAETRGVAGQLAAAAIMGL